MGFLMCVSVDSIVCLDNDRAFDHWNGHELGNQGSERHIWTPANTAALHPVISDHEHDVMRNIA